MTLLGLNNETSNNSNTEQVFLMDSGIEKAMIESKMWYGGIWVLEI